MGGKKWLNYLDWAFSSARETKLVLEGHGLVIPVRNQMNAGDNGAIEKERFASIFASSQQKAQKSTS